MNFTLEGTDKDSYKAPADLIFSVLTSDSIGTSPLINDVTFTLSDDWDDDVEFKFDVS